MGRKYPSFPPPFICVNGDGAGEERRLYGTFAFPCAGKVFDGFAGAYWDGMAGSWIGDVGAE